jgi:dienelactone hydrolase
MNTKIKTLTWAAISSVLITFGINQAVSATNFTPSPLFQDVAKYNTTISANNNLTDIYFPNPQDLKTNNYSFPIALLLQGGLVNKSNYSEYAREVARYGFVVVVPNNERSVPQFGNVLAPQTSQIDATLAQMVVENANPNSPVAGVVNTNSLALLGHSLGSAVGLSAIANKCIPNLCQDSFTRPKELVAGAFFGANLRDQNGNYITINNSGIPIALLQGNLDGRALPERAEKTYNNITTPPKALITINGANHFSITNTNNPAGAIPDPTSSTLSQDVAIETIARWSGLFLRASILNDKDAFNYVYALGDSLDSNVTLISQTQPIPEKDSVFGLIILSVCVAVSIKAKRFHSSNNNF